MLTHSLNRSTQSDLNACLARIKTPNDPEGRQLPAEVSFARAVKDGLTRLELGEVVWMVTQNLGSPQESVESIAEVYRRIAPACVRARQGADTLSPH